MLSNYTLTTGSEHQVQTDIFDPGQISNCLICYERKSSCLKTERFSAAAMTVNNTSVHVLVRLRSWSSPDPQRFAFDLPLKSLYHIGSYPQYPRYGKSTVPRDPSEEL